MNDETRWLLTGLFMAGVISRDQMIKVEKYFFQRQGEQEARNQKIDDDFWEDETRYGVGE